MRKKPLMKMEAVVRLLFDVALDRLYGVTPLRAPENCANQLPTDDHYIEGVMDMLGMALGIVHVQLTGEGIGIQEAVHDFRKQFNAAYDIVWRNKGKTMFRRMKKKKMPCPTSELLTAWPSAEKLADDFMTMCEVNR
jgi:hypothetical protein